VSVTSNLCIPGSYGTRNTYTNCSVLNSMCMVPLHVSYWFQNCKVLSSYALNEFATDWSWWRHWVLERDFATWIFTNWSSGLKGYEPTGTRDIRIMEMNCYNEDMWDSKWDKWFTCTQKFLGDWSHQTQRWEYSLQWYQRETWLRVKKRLGIKTSIRFSRWCSLCFYELHERLSCPW